MDSTRNNALLWLKSFPWSTMATLRFPHGLETEQCRQLLVKFVLRPAGIFLKDPVGAVSAILPVSPDHHPHAHVLICTKHNADIMARSGELIEYLRSQPGTIVDHKKALVLKSYVDYFHPAYLLGHFHHQNADITVYNRKLVH